MAKKKLKLSEDFFPGRVGKDVSRPDDEREAVQIILGQQEPTKNAEPNSPERLPGTAGALLGFPFVLTGNMIRISAQLWAASVSFPRRQK